MLQPSLGSGAGFPPPLLVSSAELVVAASVDSLLPSTSEVVEFCALELLDAELSLVLLDAPELELVVLDDDEVAELVALDV